MGAITKALRLAGVGLAPLAGAATDAWATAEQTFRVPTTGALIELCSTPPNDPLYTAAVHFCEGFLVGAYQYHVVAVSAGAQKPLVCPPSPAPSRNENVARFIQWSKTHPAAMGTQPVEGMFQFLSQAFPCTG